MNGLAFVAFERFLHVTYGQNVLYAYRKKMKTLPLISKTYDNTTFDTCIQCAASIIHIQVEKILFFFGKYFFQDDLVKNIYCCILRKVTSSKDILLFFSKIDDLFSYKITYKSDQLVAVTCFGTCKFLMGVIKYVAAILHEKIEIVEQTCITQGSSACRIVFQFIEINKIKRLQSNNQYAIDNILLSVLSEKDGCTIQQIQQKLEILEQHMRLFKIHEIMQHLLYAGYVESSKDDSIYQKKYKKIISFV